VSAPQDRPVEPEGSVEAAAADGAGPGASRGGLLLQVRPRRITVMASIAAVVVVVVSVVVGVLLRSSEAGVAFRAYDQFALIAVGLIIGGAILTAARPRLRVTAHGLAVRNVLGETEFPWPVVERIAFPPGANWAQLQLADDETHPVMAIQSMDRDRAVAALRQVRALHARFAPPVPPRPESRPTGRQSGPDRPLGRLELIDLAKAEAQAKTPSHDGTGARTRARKR
jgi:hypothetical protein